MNILLITTHLNIGGIASYTVNLAKALKAEGENVYVASSGGSLVCSLQESGITHISVDMNTKCELNPRLIGVVMYIKKFALMKDIGIIHAQTRVAQMVGFFVYKITGIPCVSTCHGFFGNKLSRKIFGLWGKRVIAISDAVREYLVNILKVNKSKIEVIFNGIDVSYFDKGFSAEESDKFKEKIGFKNFKLIGTIARLSPVKGIDYMIDAANMIIRERDNVAFIVIGDGPHKDILTRKVKELGISGRFKFIEAQPDTRLFLRIMDIFLLPSVQEGLGLSIMEAMASGKPVVATNVGGIYTLIKDEKTGLLIPPRSPQSLRNAIIRLLDDEKLSGVLSRNAKEFVWANFKIEDMAEKTLAVYKKVVFKE